MKAKYEINHFTKSDDVILQDKMRKKYNIVFTFVYGDDIIQYLTQRECTDLESISSYVKDWLDKYEYKYGEFMWCKIYEGKDLVYYVMQR